MSLLNSKFFALFIFNYFCNISFLCNSAFSKTENGIVVWKLTPKSGVNQKDIDSISGLITSEIENYIDMKVISDADVQYILAGQEKMQRCGSEDTYCMAELSGALGVPLAVSGDLGHVGEIWVINIRLLDVQSVNVIKRTSKQIRGSLTQVVENIPDLIAGLFTDKVKNIIGAKTAEMTNKNIPETVNSTKSNTIEENKEDNNISNKEVNNEPSNKKVNIEPKIEKKKKNKITQTITEINQNTSLLPWYKKWWVYAAVSGTFLTLSALNPANAKGNLSISLFSGFASGIVYYTYKDHKIALIKSKEYSFNISGCNQNNISACLSINF